MVEEHYTIVYDSTHVDPHLETEWVMIAIKLLYPIHNLIHNIIEKSWIYFNYSIGSSTHYFVILRP